MVKISLHNNHLYPKANVRTETIFPTFIRVLNLGILPELY